MNLLTENPSSAPRSVSVEGGGSPGGVAALDIPVEWMRWCEVCHEERRFVACIVLQNGLLGECVACGDPRVSPFTRVNSEVA